MLESERYALWFMVMAFISKTWLSGPAGELVLWVTLIGLSLSLAWIVVDVIHNPEDKE